MFMVGLESIEIPKQMCQPVYLDLDAHSMRMPVCGRGIYCLHKCLRYTLHFSLCQRMCPGKGEPRQWMWISKFTAPFLLPTPDEECERKKTKADYL